MNLTQKISQMTPKGADLAATDLIEVSTLEAGSYVTKSITGQELIDAIPLPPTGLTIGTTPIASGTIGRVLFQGTGNVLQQSSSLFWDSTNNRLGIGTETPLNPIHAFGNTNANYTGINVSNSSTGNSAISTIQVANDTGAFTIQALGSGYTASGVLQPNSARFRSSAALSNGFFMGTSSGNLVLFTNDNERLRVRETTGNVLINTTTDAGFRLDVNGTARVSGNLLLTNGIIATSTATTRLQGSLNYFTHNRIASSGLFGFQISTYGTVASFWRWTDTTYDTEIGGSSSLVGGLKLFTAGTEKMYITSGGQVGIGTSTPNANAALELSSTTRGFLPPRMTTTQKNAIASPATGLMVYDTTLNLISVYNGTTWITL
jgi:hypothetical protein